MSTPSNPEYTIEDLLKDSPKDSFSFTAEDQDWLGSIPVGKEKL